MHPLCNMSTYRTPLRFIQPKLSLDCHLAEACLKHTQHTPPVYEINTYMFQQNTHFNSITKCLKIVKRCRDNNVCEAYVIPFLFGSFFTVCHPYIDVHFLKCFYGTCYIYTTSNCLSNRVHLINMFPQLLSNSVSFSQAITC